MSWEQPDFSPRTTAATWGDLEGEVPIFLAPRWPTYRRCDHAGDRIEIRSWCNRLASTVCADCGAHIVDDG